MRVAVLGPGGRLGSCLVERFGFLPLSEDITNRESLTDGIAVMAPDVIINCAAFTDVDACEKPENEAKARKVNSMGPGFVRTAFDGWLIHISTSFVFNGKKQCRDERAAVAPINYYGMTKMGGEAAAFIRVPSLVVRVEQLYGGTPRRDFVTSIIDRLREGESISLPSEVIRTPTYIPHLAEAIAAVIARPERLTGILHLAGTDAISMLDWAKVIQQVWNLHGPRISNGPGREGEAPRPRLGGLSVKRAKSLGLPLYGLREGLVAYHNAGGWGDA
jgi:dTDP-4-dehydrorhamnose reductase